MRVFVTGASGFVGRHLVRRLVSRGCAVTALSRDVPDVHGGVGVTWVSGDALDASAYRAALHQTDAVIHLAGRVTGRRPADFTRANVMATETLVRTATEHGSGVRRFVLMSSVAAMGPAGRPGLRTERDPCRPRTHYGRSKRAAERRVLARCDALSVVVLRPAFIYGPGDWQAIGYLRMLLGTPPVLFRTPVGSVTFCHVSDVVDATLCALDSTRAAGEACLVSHPEVHTWDSILGAINYSLTALCERGQLDRGTYGALQDALQRIRVISTASEHWAFDVTAAGTCLGFQARIGLRDGAVDTMPYYLARGIPARSEELSATTLDA